MIPARAQILLFRSLLLAVVVAAAANGGCNESPAVTDTLQLGNGPLVASGGRGARTSDTLFESPESYQVAAYYGRESLPEHSRLDGSMNISNPGPRLATNEWTQDPAPDLTNIRYIYLPTYVSSSSMVVPVFQRERQYWRGFR